MGLPHHQTTVDAVYAVHSERAVNNGWSHVIFDGHYNGHCPPSCPVPASYFFVSFYSTENRKVDKTKCLGRKKTITLYNVNKLR